MHVSIFDRLMHGISGAILGAITVAGSLWYFDDIQWSAVAGGAVICGLLAMVIGEPFLHWLKEIWEKENESLEKKDSNFSTPGAPRL